MSKGRYKKKMPLQWSQNLSELYVNAENNGNGIGIIVLMQEGLFWRGLVLNKLDWMPIVVHLISLKIFWMELKFKKAE